METADRFGPRINSSRWDLIWEKFRYHIFLSLQSQILRFKRSDWFAESRLSAHILCCRIWPLTAPMRACAENTITLSGKLNFEVFEKREFIEV